MRNVLLNFPTFGFIVATRAALGAGVALLISRRLTDAQRRTVGATLVAIGAVSTIPAVIAVFRGQHRASDPGQRWNTAEEIKQAVSTAMPREVGYR